ncbi:MAG: tRNA lysidine(34) synthetase TilS [Treponema sp.]|nr:tRNA lysidine(34) synthetase TilS [Treponema sp.]
MKDCPQEAVFLVAVSGGADSMALLISLFAIKPLNPVFCIHVEHGLRPADESCTDAEFVRTFCNSNGIKCHVEHIPPGKIEKLSRRKGIGIEAAARFYRHKAFKKEAARLGENTLILTAHTKDDILENTLMRILRGTGPAGLASMPVKRGRLLRPLLSFNRSEIENYLKEKDIIWREDSTNTDVKFLRNKVRNLLIPLLNESFPSWKKGLISMAQTQSLAAEFIATEAEHRIHWESHGGTKARRSQRKEKDNYLSADVCNFFAQPLIIREEAVFQGINTLSSLCALSKSIKRSVVRKFCEGKIKAADLGSVSVKLENGKIMLFAAQKEYFECGISRLISKQGC